MVIVINIEDEDFKDFILAINIMAINIMVINIMVINYTSNKDVVSKDAVDKDIVDKDVEDVVIIIDFGLYLMGNKHKDF